MTQSETESQGIAEPMNEEHDISGNELHQMRLRNLELAWEAGRTRPKKSLTVTHTIRTKSGRTKSLTYGRKDAIRLFCTECMGWEGDPKECTSPLCPLYPFRGNTLAAKGTG